MSEVRIVSLLASGTEIVAALGLLDYLVGRSHECDFPPRVQKLPVCSRPKLDYHSSSYRIDQQIRSLLKDGLSIYEIDPELLHHLQPTVIVTQTHCEVCAVSDKDVLRALGQWLGQPPRLVSTQPDDLSRVWQSILDVAEACGVPERGQMLVQQLQQRMEQIRKRCHGLSSTPRVACIEWVEPLMVAGNWVPELVQMANGRDPLGQPGRHSPLCSWERLQEADPDLIIVMPCGFDLHRTRQELPLLEQQSAWSTLRAVRQGCVYLADGSAFFNRPGPRLVETLEILAEIMHPQLHYGHEGKSWMKLHSEHLRRQSRITGE